MLVCSAVSVAQVTELSINASANSIIRSVDGEHVLVYTETATGDGYFLLYRDGDPTAQAFQVENSAKVRDVRIGEDMIAYFCGTCLGGTMGLVGMFDIAAVFSGTDNVYYGFCDWSGLLYRLKPTDLKRLDLFDSAGVVGMAMVGDSKTDLGLIEDGTTVASAWFDGSWHMCAYLNKGNVAVDNGGTDHGCHMNDDYMHPNVYTYIGSTEIFEVTAEVICEKPEGKEEMR